jgi:hypothetical protein
VARINPTRTATVHSLRIAAPSFLKPVARPLP